MDLFNAHVRNKKWGNKIKCKQMLENRLQGSPTDYKKKTTDSEYRLAR